MQDLPLKIQLHGADYAQLFLGKLRTLLQHASWEGFSQAVVSADHSSRQQALLNRNFVADPVGTLRQIQSENCSPLPPDVAAAAVGVTGGVAKRRHSKRTLVSFQLFGLSSVEQAMALFRAVDHTPSRSWVGMSKKERTKHATAFYRFKNGLYAEFLRRSDQLGELAALQSLEQERLQITPARNFSKLQCLAALYLGT